MATLRLIFAYSTVSVFILFILLSGVANQVSTDRLFINSNKSPDFSVYLSLRLLSRKDFPIDDPSRRVILIGDIHGMYNQLQALLDKVSYDPSADTLISVGDIVAKGSHKGSMDVLNYMASNNVTAVRGNHDQKVIEWYSWLRWIRGFRGGSEFIDTVHAKWEKARKHHINDPEIWVNEQIKADKGNSKWWKRIPKGWTLFGDHFEIAYSMTDAEYDYMISRPLKIHIPHIHAFVAHAGILASDPRYKPWHKNQPLASTPSLSLDQPPSSILRRLQESAILSNVPQNTDPWVTLNMRGVANKEVTRGKDGTPWSALYTQDMELCKGFESNLEASPRALPCNPATVIYGHAASRGLDIKRWTIGLDSGCVYEKRLTALVLGGRYTNLISDGDEDEDHEEDGSEYGDADEGIEIDGRRHKSLIRFGDDGIGKIVSVSCS